MTTQITHELKVLPIHFAGVRAGEKRAEFRLNDRDFKAGDLLLLREWTPPPSQEQIESRVALVHGYTGGTELRKITHVLTHEAFAPVPKDWVVLSMGDVPAESPEANVVELEAVTYGGRIDPARVLNGALAAGLREVVVAGWIGGSDRDGPGELFLASSGRDDITVHLLQRSQHQILTLAYENSQGS